MDGLNIEVGSRDSSVMEIIRDDLVPNGNLICIDKRSGWLLNAGKHFRQKYSPITSDGSKLPLSSESVNAVYAKDLFGSFDNIAVDSDGEAVFEDRTENMPKEWSRVCKTGAKIVVMEFSTPYPKGELIEEFNNVGFDLIEQNEGEDVNKVFKPGLSLPPRDMEQPPYYLIFQKK